MRRGNVLVSTIYLYKTFPFLTRTQSHMITNNNHMFSIVCCKFFLSTFLFVGKQSQRGEFFMITSLSRFSPGMNTTVFAKKESRMNNSFVSAFRPIFVRHSRQIEKIFSEYKSKFPTFFGLLQLKFQEINVSKLFYYSILTKSCQVLFHPDKNLPCSILTKTWQVLFHPDKNLASIVPS